MSAIALAMVAWLSLLPASDAVAQPLREVPTLRARVNDLTGTLSASDVTRIEQRLASVERRKGSQIAVLMVDSTQPESIEQYAIRVAETWKIGRGKVQGQAVDDGVLLLVAKTDRTVRIEVGYGLEGAIPDALARRIIAEAIVPRFRAGDFAGGLDAAVDDLIRLIDGEALPQPWRPGQREGPEPVNWLALALTVLIGGLLATQVLGRVLGSMAGGVGAGWLVAGAGLSLAVAVGAGIAMFLFLLAFGGVSGGRGGGPFVMLPRDGSARGGGWGGWGHRNGGGFSGGGGGFGGGGASGKW